MKFYVIGSLKQQDTIKQVANFLSSCKDATVEYVKPEANKNFQQCVSSCFSKILWTDTICAITKNDGKIGEGVIYELEYAKRLGKKIFIINKKENNLWVN